MSQKTKQPKTRDEIIEEIKPILKEHKVTKAGIFGSYARDEASKGSDLDIIVDFEPSVDLFDMVGTRLALEEHLDKSVDLITFDSLKKELEPYVYSDLMIFLNK